MFGQFDYKFIAFCRKISLPLARFAIFLVYFWFGFLKIIDQSPASPLVQKLFEKTVPVLNFHTFLIWFGIFECAVGILFLIPKLERLALFVLFLHIITTVLPLILLTAATWNGFLAPTLEGQYIIKNILIIASAIYIASSLKPSSQPLITNR